ncbi:hypothetical protein ACLOJK_026635 [Asimina triloba]
MMRTGCRCIARVSGLGLGLETKEEDGERSKGRRRSDGVGRGKTTVYLTEGSSQRRRRLPERMISGTAAG